jgi:hypothetical protein
MFGCAVPIDKAKVPAAFFLANQQFGKSQVSGLFNKFGEMTKKKHF